MLKLPDDEVSAMSDQQMLVTNAKYINKDVIWNRFKCLRCVYLTRKEDYQIGNYFPDGAAFYWVSNIKMPKNSSLIVKGQYPHSRIFSFNIANHLGNGQIGNGDYINENEIIPDVNSSNPFLPGAYRNVTERNYTIFVQQGVSPPNRANNTIYTGTNSEKERVYLILRIYFVDEGYEGSGVHKLYEEENGLPIIYLKLPGDKIISGPDLIDILQPLKEANPPGYALQQWLEDIENSNNKTNAPAFPIAVSQVFWDTNYSVTGAFLADNPEKRVREYPPTGEGGFGNFPGTKYMLMIISFDYGEIVVINAKMPTHPMTRRGNIKLSERKPMVQYFSITTSGSPFSGMGWKTKNDEQIAVDEYGNYTVVISWPENRPKNAVLKNNITWIDAGKGEGNYVGARDWLVAVISRFSGCRDNWKNSPAKIPMPTVKGPIPQDESVMGPYYQMGRYMSKEYFEQNWPSAPPRK